jgi:outer membrane lipoprotein-sorting protein
MKRAYFLLLLLTLVAVAPQKTVPPLLAKHVDALSKAETLRVRFTVQRGTYAAEEYTLLYSRWGSFRIESASEILVWDGAKVVRFDKRKNEYTEGEGFATATRVFMEPRFWAWSAFFDRKPWEGIGPATTGAKRAILGARVTEVLVRYGEPPLEYRLMVEDANGMVRAWTTKVGGDDLLVMATSVEVSSESANASEFSFTPPEGAKKVESAASSAPTFADAQTVLRARCLPCHSRGSRLGGHEFETYEGVLRAVKPGDPDGSLLIRVVSPPNPTMPQGGSPLSAEQVRLLRDWVAAGAKQ